ncbi:MAG TPA: divalent-cation tolerance protein CutA [Thermoanaerobaculia bacterium]|nr:divalent-cation tolerance protein CutA [Thermoanaerobaculia bacterium]
MSASPILVLSTAGSMEEGERIARALVEERLAACVNLVPGVRSVYRWRGEVQSDAEVLLVIKTVRERFPALRARVRELHSYELPELVCIEPSGGEEEYLAWVVAETRVE